MTERHQDMANVGQAYMDSESQSQWVAGVKPMVRRLWDDMKHCHIGQHCTTSTLLFSCFMYILPSLTQMQFLLLCRPTAYTLFVKAMLWKLQNSSCYSFSLLSYGTQRKKINTSALVGLHGETMF